MGAAPATMSGTIRTSGLAVYSPSMNGGNASHQYGRPSRWIAQAVPASPRAMISTTATSADTTLNGTIARRLGGGAAYRIGPL